MARKKGNGRDEAAMALFHDMLTELRGINARLDRVEGEVRDLRGEVHGLRGEVHELRGEVHGVKSRLEHVLDFVGERYRDHDERLRRVESKVFGT